MTTPLFEFVGTWQEITAQLPSFGDQKVRVIVYPATEGSPEGLSSRPIPEILAEIALMISAAEHAKLPADFCDQLDHYLYGTPKK